MGNPNHSHFHLAPDSSGKATELYPKVACQSLIGDPWSSPYYVVDFLLWSRRQFWTSRSLAPPSLANDLASHFLEKIETVKWGSFLPTGYQIHKPTRCFLSSPLFRAISAPVKSPSPHLCSDSFFVKDFRPLASFLLPATSHSSLLLDHLPQHTNIFLFSPYNIKI